MNQISSSKELFGKIHRCLKNMDDILKDNNLTAEVQASDINSFSWGLIELVHKFNDAVASELSDIE